MSERVDAVAEEEVGTENLHQAAETQTEANQGSETPAVEASTVEASTPEEPTVEESTAEASATATESTATEVSAPEVTATSATEPEATEPAEASAAPSATVDTVNAEQAAEQEPTEENSAEPVAADATAQTSQESTPESTTNPESTANDESTDSEGEKKVVRTLTVGEQVTGTVKRIADFGAFVDIGVGRDGLIHISELSVRRVGKVTDMLAEGQEVTAWIKKLDRDRNRISLTLVDPDTKTIRDLQKGDIVTGRVTRLLPYGAFVDIGIGRDALLHVREMAEGFVAKPEDVVNVDEELEARVIDLSRRRSRVDLSLKGLRPEPEAAVPHQSENSQAAVDEPEVVEDAFEDVEVLSPMELAFKRAMEADGAEVQPQQKRGKRNRRMSRRDLQDEIISRTLTDGGR